MSVNNNRPRSHSNAAVNHMSWVNDALYDMELDIQKKQLVNYDMELSKILSYPFFSVEKSRLGIMNRNKETEKKAEENKGKEKEKEKKWENKTEEEQKRNREKEKERREKTVKPIIQKIKINGIPVLRERFATSVRESLRMISEKVKEDRSKIQEIIVALHEKIARRKQEKNAKEGIVIASPENQQRVEEEKKRRIPALLHTLGELRDVLLDKYLHLEKKKQSLIMAQYLQKMENYGKAGLVYTSGIKKLEDTPGKGFFVNSAEYKIKKNEVNQYRIQRNERLENIKNFIKEQLKHNTNKYNEIHQLYEEVYAYELECIEYDNELIRLRALDPTSIYDSTWKLVLKKMADVIPNTYFPVEKQLLQHMTPLREMIEEFPTYLSTFLRPVTVSRMNSESRKSLGQYAIQVKQLVEEVRGQIPLIIGVFERVRSFFNVEGLTSSYHIIHHYRNYRIKYDSWKREWNTLIRFIDNWIKKLMDIRKTIPHTVHRSEEEAFMVYTRAFGNTKAEIDAAMESLLIPVESYVFSERQPVVQVAGKRRRRMTQKRLRH